MEPDPSRTTHIHLSIRLADPDPGEEEFFLTRGRYKIEKKCVYVCGVKI